VPADGQARTCPVLSERLASDGRQPWKLKWLSSLAAANGLPIVVGPSGLDPELADCERLFESLRKTWRQGLVSPRVDSTRFRYAILHGACVVHDLMPVPSFGPQPSEPMIPLCSRCQPERRKASSGSRDDSVCGFIE
jgi:hypothetical protein